MKRLGYLDGLRGLLALIVFGEHFLKTFYPTALTHETIWSGGSWMDIAWVFSPLTFLYNGGFAVAGFFVLSGYLLTRSVWYTKRGGGTFHLKQIVRRYLRFAVPITLSLFTILILGQLGYLDNTAFIAEYGSSLKSIYYLPEPLTFIEVFKQGFFTSLFAFDFSHNPVLWVMTPEMLCVLALGAFGVVFNNFATSRNSRIIFLATFLMATLFFVSGYLFVGFWIGAFVFAVELLWRRYHKTDSIVAIGLVAIGGAMVCLDLKGGSSNPFTLGEGRDHLSNIIYTIYGIGWGAMLLGILQHKALQRLLSHSALQSIGKASFGIYLFHYPLLAAIAVPTVQALTLPWGASTFVAGVLTLLVSYAVGEGCLRLIEKPIMKGRRIRFSIGYSSDYQLATGEK